MMKLSPPLVRERPRVQSSPAAPAFPSVNGADFGRFVIASMQLGAAICAGFVASFAQNPHKNGGRHGR
jgi:hypothetical protein